MVDPGTVDATAATVTATGTAMEGDREATTTITTYTLSGNKMNDPRW
jgi:hypothetical protein